MKKLTDEEIEQQRLERLADEELEKLTAKTIKEFVPLIGTFSDNMFTLELDNLQNTPHCVFIPLIQKMHQHLMHIATVFNNVSVVDKSGLCYFLFFPHIKAHLKSQGTP